MGREAHVPCPLWNANVEEICGDDSLPSSPYPKPKDPIYELGDIFLEIQVVGGKLTCKGMMYKFVVSWDWTGLVGLVTDLGYQTETT